MSWLLSHVSWIWEFALPFGVVLGVVVLFHEFGHYLVAKWLGVTVEIFSVGFGPRLAGFKRGGTDYRVSWVPLGGYVKLKGETPEEGNAQDPGDLLSRSRFQRFLVFVMGAVFNLVTAYVLTVVILMMGTQEPVYPGQPPVVGEIAGEPRTGSVSMKNEFRSVVEFWLWSALVALRVVLYFPGSRVALRMQE